MTELKLEVGKTYLNGYGEKVYIFSTSDTHLGYNVEPFFIDTRKGVYNSSGRAFRSSNSMNNLVKEG